MRHRSVFLPTFDRSFITVGRNVGRTWKNLEEVGRSWKKLEEVGRNGRLGKQRRRFEPDREDKQDRLPGTAHSRKKGRASREFLGVARRRTSGSRYSAVLLPPDGKTREGLLRPFGGAEEGGFMKTSQRKERRFPAVSLPAVVEVFVRISLSRSRSREV